MPDEQKLPNPFVVFTTTFDETYRNLSAKWNIEGPIRGEGAEEPLPRAEPETVVSTKLVENFDDAMTVLRGMFTKAENTLLGGLQLDTMEVNLEVTAEGKLAFMGSGGSLSGKTSFTLTFKKPSATDSVSKA